MSTISFPLTLEFQEMPLGVYREVQAHLQQLQGLEVELLPQVVAHFDYCQSQLGGVRVQESPGHSFLEDDRSVLKEILAFYHRLYPLCNPQVLTGL
ncbi:MAG: hypothetical protein ACO31I_05640 [Prochlorotrichaceae cyanobacterium]|jgi:hypothetical protein